LEIQGIIIVLDKPRSDSLVQGNTRKTFVYEGSIEKELYKVSTTPTPTRSSLE
jgi:hypothetical protein